MTSKWVRGENDWSNEMLTAAKAITLTGADLVPNPRLVADAKAGFQHQLAGKSYQSGVPAGQKPPLDYRK